MVFFCFSKGAGPYNGVESFFRGSGKALASLMTRGGVSDCIDVANDAIRRAALMGERINVRQRLHRHIQSRIVSFNLIYL